MWNSERSVAPVLAIVLMVAVVVVIGASVTGFVLVIAESISEPAPSTVFERGTTEDGTIRLQHTAGETLEGDNIDVEGGIVRGKIPEKIGAGDTIEIAPSGDRTAVVWESGDSGDASVLTSLDTSLHPLAATGASEDWQRDDLRTYEGDIVATDGFIYVAGELDLRSYDRDTGRETWKNNPASGDRFQSIEYSSGVLYTGTVAKDAYDPTEGAKLVAVDATDGSEIWNHSAHRDYDGTPVGIEENNDVVYSIDDEGFVIATDASRGNVLWERSLDTGESRDLYVADGVVYTGYEALDASDGSTIWRQGSKYSLIRDIDGSDGVLYVGTIDDGTVAALDTDDGSTIWERRIDDSPGEIVPAVFENRGVLYAGLQNNSVVAMDADDGSTLWRHEIHNNNVQAITEYGGVVYSIDDENELIAAKLKFEDE